MYFLEPLKMCIFIIHLSALQTTILIDRKYIWNAKEDAGKIEKVIIKISKRIIKENTRNCILLDFESRFHVLLSELISLFTNDCLLLTVNMYIAYNIYTCAMSRMSIVLLLMCFPSGDLRSANIWIWQQHTRCIH